MGANPHANGGQLKKALRLPDFREYGIKFDKPGQIEAENTRPLGVFLRDLMKMNIDTFRILCSRREYIDQAGRCV
jgi:xylulose-5-phosphate/fructose-6-phosphate phosphoketolase